MASEEMQKVVLMNAWNWRESVVRRNNVKQQITAILAGNLAGRGSSKLYAYYYLWLM